MSQMKEIRKFLETMPRALSFIAMGKLYDKSWSKDFSWKETSGIFDKITKEAKKLKFDSMGKKELKALGFSSWDKGSDLMLIPAYLYWAIPMETKVTSIDGEKTALGLADTDTRFGCLAYGLMPSNA